MKRTSFILAACASCVLLAGALICTGAPRAEARGMLGQRMASLQAGITTFDDLDEDAAFLEAGAQAPLPGTPLPLELFGSLRRTDGDQIDLTTLRVGANVELPLTAPMRVFAGGGIVRTDTEAEDNSIDGIEMDPFLQGGIEKELEASLAVQGRVSLEDGDLGVHGDIIKWFSDRFAGTVGVEQDMDGDEYSLRAGIALAF